MHRPPGTPSNGLRFGRFAIQRLLGSDGMGTAEEAYDTRLDVTVVLKTIRADLIQSDPADYADYVDRFNREARAGARVRGCPQLVTVYDLFAASDGTPCLVLEFVPGGDLRQLIAQGPVASNRALAIIADAARGLEVMHAHNLVHRDIKPGNIFLTADGHAKVGDFGIVQMDNLSGRTGGAQYGHDYTRLYASPEQLTRTDYLRGETDQYSLGLVLFELLVGKPHKQQYADEIEHLLAQQPATIAALIRKMTAMDPADRYRGMAALLTAIEAIDLTAPLRLYSVRQTAIPPQQTAPELPLIPSVRIPVMDAQGVAFVAFSPDGDTLASRSGNGTINLWRVSDGSKLHTISERHGGIASAPSVAFSRDGGILASGAHSGAINLWRVSDGSQLRTSLTQPLKGDYKHSTVWSVAFSPDGGTLAAGTSDGRILLRRVDGTLLHALTDPFAVRTTPAFSVAFSPDSDMLAAAADHTTINLWRISNGSLLHTLTGNFGSVPSMAFSPDGRTLASGGGSMTETIDLWRVSDGTLLGSFEGDSFARVMSVAFSPDGGTLASGLMNKRINLWRISDGTVLYSLIGHSERVYSVAFSPYGDTLASGAFDNTIRLWKLK